MPCLYDHCFQYIWQQKLATKTDNIWGSSQLHFWVFEIEMTFWRTKWSNGDFEMFSLFLIQKEIWCTVWLFNFDGEVSHENLISNMFEGLIAWVRNYVLISPFIRLREKFLPFDWLRAEVFHLNYLHMKITVTMVTQNHQIILISRFWNQEIQELKENSENPILRKVHWPGSMSGPAGPKRRTSKPICSPTKRNNSTKINTWG